MKKKIAILLAGLMGAILAGCAQPAGDSNAPSNRSATAPANTAAPANPAVPEAKNANAANGNSSAAAAPANTNSNVSSGPAPAPPDATKLVGSYLLNQIQKQGVVTMMSEVKTELIFTADGRYPR